MSNSNNPAHSCTNVSKKSRTDNKQCKDERATATILLPVAQSCAILIVHSRAYNERRKSNSNNPAPSCTMFNTERI